MVSPELTEVLALIISRVRNGAEWLPLVTRYDGAERLHTPPLPFLFQRPCGLANHILTPHRVKVLLDRTAAVAGLTAADGGALRFKNLDARLAEARDQGWLGESRGSKKLTNMHRAAAPAALPANPAFQ